MNRRSGFAAVIIGILTATIPTFVLFQAVTFLFVVPLVLGMLCVLLGMTALRTGGKFAKHVGWIVVILMLIAVILPFGMIAYHNRSGYPIELVISEGYRGPVRLIIDRQQGVDVPLVDGKYTYRIPETGTLLIKDDSPFRQWHSMTATYTSGKLIPIDYEGDLPPDTVSLHSLGSGVSTQGGKQEKYIEDFVGTRAELRKYVDRR
jgi:hypothetical protein